MNFLQLTLIGVIISAVLSVSNTIDKRNEAINNFFNDYKYSQIEQFKIINNSINAYCSNPSLIGNPDFNDLYSNNIYLGRTDNILGNNMNIIWDVNNSYYKIQYDVSNKIDTEKLLKLQNGFSYKLFGESPSCVSEKSDVDYGKCLLKIHLGYICQE